MALRLVHSTLDRAVWVRALAGDIVLCSFKQDTLVSQWLFPPRCANGTAEFNAGGNPAMD